MLKLTEDRYTEDFPSIMTLQQKAIDDYRAVYGIDDNGDLRWELTEWLTAFRKENSHGE